MKTPALSAVDDAEAELSRARLSQEDIEARALRRDPDVTQDDREAAAKLVSWCEMRLEGAHNADLDAAKAARDARWPVLLDELRAGSIADLAAAIAVDAAAERERLAQLHARVATYASIVGRSLVEAGQLGDPPEGVAVDVDHVGRVRHLTAGDITWTAPGRDLATQLVEGIVADVVLDAGARSVYPPEHDRRAARSVLGRIWARFAAAHPGRDWPGKPERDRARLERQAVRRSEQDYDRRARTARTADEVVRAAYAAANAGDGAAVHEACSSPYWPPGEPFPAGYRLLTATPDETPAEAATAAPAPIAPRSRRKSTPAPTDPLPPAA